MIKEAGGPSPRRIGIGVVGLGRIGRVHAENLAFSIKPARLISVADADEANCRTVAGRLGVDWTEDGHTLIGDERVDAIVIATPTVTHAEFVQSACTAEKHVFCEKPLSTELGESHRLLELAREAGVQLQVGLHMRFDPSLAQLVDRIRAGELGDVYLFKAAMRDREPPGRVYLEQSGGFVLDGAIHTLDLARYMIGEVRELMALGAAASDPVFAELGDVDNLAVAVRFLEGGLGVLEHSRTSGYGFECQVEVVGSRRAARVAGDHIPDVEWLDRGIRSTAYPSDFLERFAVAYRLELESFIRALAEQVPVRASGEDAVAAARLCDAAALSIRERRCVSVGTDAARTDAPSLASSHPVI